MHVQHNVKQNMESLNCIPAYNMLMLKDCFNHGLYVGIAFPEKKGRGGEQRKAIHYMHCRPMVSITSKHTNKQKIITQH